MTRPRQVPQTIGRNSANSNELMEQAHRQIPFHAFKVDRDAVLASQWRSGQISGCDLMRAPLLSNKFPDDFWRGNSNYQMLDPMVDRVLGPPVYGHQERIALSILMAQQGLGGLWTSWSTRTSISTTSATTSCPYQRSRLLAGHSQGAQPFNQQAPY